MHHYSLKACLICAIGLATFGLGAHAEDSPLPRPDIEITRGVPFFPQKVMGCGPAALAGILAYWDVPVTLEEITREVFNPRLKGALAMDLALAAERRGLAADSYSGNLDDLRRLILLHEPPIVFLNLNTRLFPQGHFVIVTGYDGPGAAVVAHTGIHPNERIPVAEFMKAWEKTGYWTVHIRPREKPVPS
ncbi:MAG TPA: cysteine peptidase family C39 domain-containing protein [Nitrospiria bacterium]